MKETTCFNKWEKFLILTVLFLMASVFTSSIWTLVSYKTPNFVGRVCREKVKKTIYKMGPKYDYIMKGEKLYVNKGDGKWLRLKYERR